MADGGTGFAAFEFDHRTFIAYVGATVVFEAWFIGVRGGYDWPKSILISVAVNAFTAFLCVSPEFFIMAQRKPYFNPNSLEWTFQPLILYALFSSLIEGFLWAPRLSGKGFVGRSILAHIACIPISIAILVLPSRPYQALERGVFGDRMSAITGIRSGLEQEIRSKRKVPELKSIPDLICLYKPVWSNAKSNLAVIGYVPEYSRFDTGESFRHPVEINHQAVGAKVKISDDYDYYPKRGLWLIRGHLENGLGDSYRGLIVDLDSGHVVWTNDGEKLGYGKTESGDYGP